MKKSLATAAVLYAACSLLRAEAADVGGPTVPVYPGSPPFAPVPFTWTGFYIGGNAGYGAAFTTTNFTFTGGSLDGVTGGDTTKLSGAVLGGQVGVNWQIGTIVVGAEGDFQWSNQRKDSVTGCGIGCTLNETGKIDLFGTARARIGAAAIERVLFYVTAGAAWTSASDVVNATGFGQTVNLLTLSGSKVGWTAGIGVESAVWNNFTFKTEYLFVDTRGLTGTAAVPAVLGGGTVTESAHFRDSIIRFGINYLFQVGR
jgi:outer membrane immunogenic protein